MASSTTTSTSLSTAKPNLKDLCIICEIQPYDLICTCGDKFDFNCIHQHVEQIGYEFRDQHQQVSEKLTKINDLHKQDKHQSEAIRTIIDNWRRKRIQDIDNIVEKAFNDLQQREDVFTDIPSFHQLSDQLATDSHRIAHDRLNKVIELNQQIQNTIGDVENLPAVNHNDASLDAVLQAKLQPLIISTNHSSSSVSNTRDNLGLRTNEIEPGRSSASPSAVLNTNAPVEPSVELNNTDLINELTEEIARNDELDSGQTRHIQRTNPIRIPAQNDQYAGTICCHDNQLLYNNYDPDTQNFQLVFIRDIEDRTTKQTTITWNPPDTTIDVADDGWIQDIVYSYKLTSYLLLNRARVRLYNVDTDELDEFHTFPDRTMKRLSCSERWIYLISTHNSVAVNGDEITIMNYDKEEQLCKTFRDIVPSRLNRGSGPLAGEISDIAVRSDEQVSIGYRLQRRQEVGVCVFNLNNDGREWTCVKHLSLNDCWHTDLSYTPRIDWCEKLNVFILMEYMTGHLIFIDRDGQTEGECPFMQGPSQRDPPINLTISANDWFCVRYPAFISIHKITS